MARASGAAVEPVPLDQVRSVLPEFVGEILQRPPAFSAMKVDGRRAYDLARKGGEVALEPRPVRVYGIDLLDYAWPDLRSASTAAAARTSARSRRDLGERLDVGGYLTELRRTRVGTFDVKEAVTLEGLTPEMLARNLQPVPE